MKAYILSGFLAFLLAGCTVVKNSDATTCSKHNCKVHKGFAKNRYGRVCIDGDGSLLKIGRCGGCVVSRNPFKRYSYIKYCPKCQKEWKQEQRNRTKEN